MKRNEFFNNKRSRLISMLAALEFFTKRRNLLISTLVSCLLIATIPVSAFAQESQGKKGTEGKNNVRVISSNQEGCILEFTVADFDKAAVKIRDKEYFSINLPGEGLLQTEGSPELPTITRSIAIPHGVSVTSKIESVEYKEQKMLVAPSKGNVTRDKILKEIPFSFSKIYKEDKFFPQERVTLGNPYLIRDVRGVAVTVSPFAYNPLNNELRVYNKIVVNVKYQGKTERNAAKIIATDNSNFTNIYAKQFLNFDPKIFDIFPLLGVEMLVITNDNFVDEMKPFVTHKNSIGLVTKMVKMSTVGTTSTDIKNYIQNYYNTHKSLSYVLLVGDYAQVPSPMYQGGGSDPSYSLVSGADNYPDIFVGRFSAETKAHVNTMVDKSIMYETTSKGAWFHNGMGIASSQGTGDDGEYDYQHIRNIRTGLLAWHYNNIGEFYDGSQGGVDVAGNPSAASIESSINAGTSIINYTGHGSTTSWSTSGFSNTNINNLTNDNKLPFVYSVACVNGNFTSATCFGEAWLRAKNSATGKPTGAIGFYGSSINQSWNPPMEAQDEFNKLLANRTFTSFGELCFNSSISMMNAYGGGNNQAGTNMFLTWNLFGDPSVNVWHKDFNKLPKPVLEIQKNYFVTSTSAYHNLKVKNWTKYPNQMFENVLHLPINSSRTWVSIHDGSTDVELKTYKYFDANDDLTKMYIKTPKYVFKAKSVYVVIHDREYNKKYVSNKVNLPWIPILKPIELIEKPVLIDPKIDIKVINPELIKPGVIKPEVIKSEVVRSEVIVPKIDEANVLELNY